MNATTGMVAPRSETRKRGIVMTRESGQEAWRVKSVIKALNVLDLFSPNQPELSLAQMAQTMDMPKSTLLNLLKTLEGEGYLLHGRDTQTYRLGFRALQLGYNVRSSMAIIQYAIPFMEDLLARTGETVYLTSHVHGQVLYLDGAYNSRRFGKYSITGKTLPMHCTGCGKAMLSQMTEEEVRRVIDRWGLKRFTPNTITELDELLDQLALSRERGYAIDNEEETLGVRCVATAIRNTDGCPVGAISIQGTMMSMTEDCIREYAGLIASVSTILSENAHLFPADQLSRGRVNF